MNIPDWQNNTVRRRSLRLDSAVPGSGPDVFRRAKRKRHDGHRGLTAARGDKTRTVTNEKVRNIVRAVIPVYNGNLRIVSHAARP
jgi:hypothetical protein